MDERQRRQAGVALGGGPEDDDGSGLTARREAFDRLISAGNRAIDEVLSRDSRSFLERSRQQGGQ